MPSGRSGLRTCGLTTVPRHCTAGLVAGHFQPLADDGPVAGTSDQTLALPAVDSESEAKHSHMGTECFASTSGVGTTAAAGEPGAPHASFPALHRGKSSGCARDFPVARPGASRGVLAPATNYLISTFAPASSSFF